MCQEDRYIVKGVKGMLASIKVTAELAGSNGVMHQPRATSKKRLIFIGLVSEYEGL